MNSIKQMLNKQIQLLEIEFKPSRVSMHNYMYYKKMIMVYKLLNFCVKTIDSMNNNIYDGRNLQQ